MGTRNVDWSAVCSCGCPANEHYADDGCWHCMKHMELGDHEWPRRQQRPTPPPPPTLAEACEVIRALVGQAAPCRCEDPNCEWRRAHAFLVRVKGGGG